MDIAGAVIGAAAAVGAEAAADAVAAVTKGPQIDYEELVAPVPQEMRDAWPGLEFFQLPDQKHLVVQQKVEPGELVTDMLSFGLAVSDVPIEIPGIERPNTYAVRSRDTGVTYYMIQELDNGCMGCICRDQCRQNMPMKLAVKNMRTKQVVGRIESPWACEPCCCGCWWFLCLIPIPVCCCTRRATWQELSGQIPTGGDEDIENVYYAEPVRDIASATIGFTHVDCGCARQMDISTADESVKFSLFKRCCCCGPKGCFGDAELISDWNMIDDTHPWETPLGRIFNSFWKQDYIPTNESYPPLVTEGGFMDLLKEIGKDLFTDADTSLIECPFDAANAKAGLVTAAIVSDYFYKENDSLNSNA